MICVHCGLPATRDCVNHVQSVTRKQKTVKVERDTSKDQSIHPRVRNGRTVFPKSNTAAKKRA